jgi:uncharacterized membrane protein
MNVPIQFPHLVWVHIIGGLIGLLAGTAAMTYRKGSQRHGLAGDVFVIAMMCMSGTGAFMGWMNHLHGLPGGQMANFFNGTFVFYLVATGWLTARRTQPETSAIDSLGCGVAAAIGSGMYLYAWRALHDPQGLADGYPAGIYFFFGSMAFLCAAGDVRMLIRGGVTGTMRVVRHLWRMSFAFLIAVFSFFLGQQKVFPASWRGNPVWFAPPIAALVLLVYWFARVKITGTYKRKVVARAGAPELNRVTAA